jgi:NADH-quinone oxidoreductase subunit F
MFRRSSRTSVAETRQLLLEHADGADLTKLAEYERFGGYRQLRKALSMAPGRIKEEVDDSGILGRGGAAFPMGRKMQFVPSPDQTAKPIYFVVNADESEPGTFKDREIMLRVPHLLIEGILISSFAIGASHAFVYIRGEYLDAFEVLQTALDEAASRGLVGANVLGSGWSCSIVIHRGAGAYICGEETALLDSLEGRRGKPRTKPPFPAISGLYAAPTEVNNVETVAAVPKILELGGKRYAEIGVEGGTGTRLVSLSGNVARPGNYEIEIGSLTLRELIDDIGGGVPEGRLKAIIPGGSSTPILTANDIDIPVDYASIAKAGSSFGSAGFVVIDDRCNMVHLALRVAQFYMQESCGKCTPCREGVRWQVEIIRRIAEGRATQGELDLLLDVCDRILGQCLCPLGDSSAIAVASYVAKFREDFQQAIDEGGCPPGSSLEGVAAPVDEHYRRLFAGMAIPAVPGLA